MSRERRLVWEELSRTRTHGALSVMVAWCRGVKCCNRESSRLERNEAVLVVCLLCNGDEPCGESRQYVGVAIEECTQYP